MFYCVIQKCLYNLWDNAVFWSFVWISFIARFRIIHDLIVFVHLTWIHLWPAPSKSLLISSSVITCEHLTHCLAPAHFLYSIVPMVTCRNYFYQSFLLSDSFTLYLLLWYSFGCPDSIFKSHIIFHDVLSPRKKSPSQKFFQRCVGFGSWLSWSIYFWEEGIGIRLCGLRFPHFFE